MLATTDSSSDRRLQPSFQHLLADARQGSTAALGRLLQWYLNYLTILATSQLDRRIQQRVSPSDVVQEAMLAAHRDFGAFRGSSQGELLGWLRQILINTLHRTFALHVKAGKRDVRREISMHEISRKLDESVASLSALIPAQCDSPSAAMQAREDAVDLANQLSTLRPQYRDVIVYRVLQGLSFDEVAERMGRSSGAVRMLWLRALEAFKIQGAVQYDD